MTFCVAASGTSPLAYQWRENGSGITGASSSSYTINPVAAGDAASYDVVVSNSCSSVTSTSATLAVNNPPSISSQPANQTKFLGQSVTFSVSATGTGLAYQWRKNGSNISGANRSSYPIPSVTTDNAGSYDVVVSGTCAPAATSTAATLTVRQMPPDPSTVAPPLDPTVATTMASAVSFLYSGDTPIQTGVAAGVMDPVRIAVIRGKTKDPNGTALPGVSITVLDHPEFGGTLTRADGMFDMAVNGGGPLTVTYRKGGLLTVHRQLAAPTICW